MIHGNTNIPLETHNIQLVEFTLNHTPHSEAVLLLSKSTKTEAISLFRFHFSKLPVSCAWPQYLQETCGYPKARKGRKKERTRRQGIKSN